MDTNMTERTEEFKDAGSANFIVNQMPVDYISKIGSCPICNSSKGEFKCDGCSLFVCRKCIELRYRGSCVKCRM